MRVQIYVKCVLFAGFLLSPILDGCATAPQSPIPAPVAAPSCIPVASYTPVQEAAVASEIEHLTANDPLLNFIHDYERLRAAARAACGK